MSHHTGLKIHDSHITIPCPFVLCEVVAYCMYNNTHMCILLYRHIVYFGINNATYCSSSSECSVGARGGCLGVM